MADLEYLPFVLKNRKGREMAVVMRSDLVGRIEDANLTGLCLTPMGDQIW